MINMTRVHIRDVSPKAVVLGAVVDIVGTNVAMMPIAILVMMRLGSGLSSSEQSAALSAAFTNDPKLYLAGMLLGSAASILGGWFAARIAGKAELLNGALSAVACVAFGVYGTFAYPDAVPLWQHVLFVVLSPALGALGGSIRRRQHERAAASPPIVELDVAATIVPRLTGSSRAVYVANRALAAFAVLALLFFGLVGLYGYSQHDSGIILGSVIVCAFGVIVLALLRLGARRLREGRRSHWIPHGVAVLMVALPIGLMIAGGRS
jgi:hypothetical protein